MQPGWIAGRPFKILVLGAAVLVLQQVTVPYNLTIGGEHHPYASLVHLRIGLMLAIAMLERDRLVLAGCVFAEWCGWMIVAWQRDYSLAMMAVGVVSPFFAYAWLVLCTRWMGWPRPPALQRVSTSDVIRFALIGLLLFPMGYMVINLAMLTADRFAASAGFTEALGAALPGMVQGYFARYFGVAVLTLPLVIAWTQRHEPTPPNTWRVWLWLPALATVLLASMGLNREVLEGLGGAPGFTLMDYRLPLVAAVGLCMLNLRPSLAMLLFSGMLFVLVRTLVGAATASDTALGSINLAHLGLEVGILSIGLLYYTVVVRDRRNLLVDVGEQSRRDSVTGLPNYNALREQPEARPGASGQVGYLLLDQADALAAGFGLDAQATIMNAVAARLAGSARCYYLGTGQFALLADGGAASEATWAGILAAVERMELRVAERRVRMTPYLGVVAFGSGGRDDFEHVLLSASNLAYEARRHNEVKPLHADAAQASPGHDGQRRLLDAGDAIAGLRAGRLVLHFQAICPLDGDTRDRRLRGEVLCRLFDEQGRVIPTARFIDCIEAARAGPELDLAVLGELFRELRAQPAALPCLGSISVNLTGQSLSSESFRTRLEDLLASAPVALTRLCFEITETAAITNPGSARNLLQSLRAKGCRVAIDDFGTGMQSFARLRDLPFDIIKIDGLFVRNMLEDQRDFEVVQASVAVARAFGADTVAEYVENQALADGLHAIGVRWGQGYHFARPRPLREVLAEATRA